MTAMDRVLRDDEATRYGRDGLVFPIDVLSEGEARAYRERLEDAETRFGPMHYLIKPHLLLTLADELVHHPRIVGALGDLLGPDVLLWDSAFIIKEPMTDKFVSWHQDLTYWGLSSDDVVSVWLALSPATAESGCMRMIPGSHRRGAVEHHNTHARENVLSRGQTIAQPIDESQAVVASLRPGQMSLHHGWTYHASFPNRTNDRRIGLNMNAIAPSVYQIKMADDTATLLSGQDRHGHFGPEPRPAFDFAAEACAFQADISRRRGKSVNYDPTARLVNPLARPA
jgi:hypothetical protein